MKKLCLALLAALVGLSQAELDLKQLCLNTRVNEVIAHPQDCRGYIFCSEQPSEHFCDVGFHFDNKRLVCDWPEIVKCQLPSQPVEDDSAVPVKPVLTPLMALNIMSGEVIDPMIAYDPLNVICHFGAYFLPNPKQCRSYYLCAYGHMHELACGPNTMWDYTTQQCVLNYEAFCYQLSQDEENEIEESLANNMENNSLACYPVNPTTTTITAAPKTISSTVWEQTVNNTSMTVPIPTPPTILEASTKKPNISNPYNIICSPKRQSYVAHPKDCSKYFMCIVGMAVMTSCPEGL